MEVYSKTAILNKELLYILEYSKNLINEIKNKDILFSDLNSKNNEPEISLVLELALSHSPYSVTKFNEYFNCNSNDINQDMLFKIKYYSISHLESIINNTFTYSNKTQDSFPVEVYNSNNNYKFDNTNIESTGDFNNKIKDDELIQKISDACEKLELIHSLDNLFKECRKILSNNDLNLNSDYKLKSYKKENHHHLYKIKRLNKNYKRYNLNSKLKLYFPE